MIGRKFALKSVLPMNCPTSEKTTYQITVVSIPKKPEKWFTNSTRKTSRGLGMNKSHPIPLITISEAARILNVHKETLRRWDKDKRLQAIRLPSGHRRYKVLDVFMIYTHRLIMRLKETNED